MIQSILSTHALCKLLMDTVPHHPDTRQALVEYLSQHNNFTLPVLIEHLRLSAGELTDLTAYLQHHLQPVIQQCPGAHLVFDLTQNKLHLARQLARTAIRTCSLPDPAQGDERVAERIARLLNGQHPNLPVNLSSARHPGLVHQLRDIQLLADDTRAHLDQLRHLLLDHEATRDTLAQGVTHGIIRTFDHAQHTARLIRLYAHLNHTLGRMLLHDPPTCLITS